MNRQGDMTPQMMVLSLIAREPGTVANTQRRLTELFPSADLGRNTAYMSLPRLEKKGWVRLMAPGAEPSQDAYEVTDKGLEQRHSWLLNMPRPAQREAHGKVQFANFEELDALIRVLKDEEDACRTAGDDAHRQMQDQKRLLRRFPPKNWQEELSAELRMIHLKNQASMWADAADRRRELREDLEQTRDRFAEKAANDA